MCCRDAIFILYYGSLSISGRGRKKRKNNILGEKRKKIREKMSTNQTKINTHRGEKSEEVQKEIEGARGKGLHVITPRFSWGPVPVGILITINHYSNLKRSSVS